MPHRWPTWPCSPLPHSNMKRIIKYMAQVVELNHSVSATVLYGHIIFGWPLIKGLLSTSTRPSRPTMRHWLPWFSLIYIIDIIGLFIYLPIYLFTYLFIYLFIYIFTYLFIYLPIYLFLFIYFYLFFYLFLFIYIYLFSYLFLFIFIN